MAKNKRDILEESEKMSTKELIQRTQAVEDEKEKKKQERLAKKVEKEKRKHREKMEKLVAPILLILTIAISFVVRFLSTK